MSITLEQYRASIGGFTPPGLLKSLKRRKAAASRKLLGEEVVDRVGREGRKLWIPLVDVIIGFLLIAAWFIFVRHLSYFFNISTAIFTKIINRNYRPNSGR